MSRKIRWSSQALADLEAIADYIATDNPKAARSWVSRLKDAVYSVAEMPQTGRVVPEIATEDVREVFLRRYRIVYATRETHVFVFTVFRGDRQFRREWIQDNE